MQKTIKSIAFLFTVFSAFILTFTFILQKDLPDAYYSDSEKFQINSYSGIIACESSTDISMMTANSKISGNTETVTLRLMGVFPIKDVTVKNSARKYVTLSGQPFGIKLYTDGVMVVSLSEIDTDSGKKKPAQNAGIKAGDIILEINGEKISSNEDMALKIDKSNGKKVSLLIKRGNTEIMKNLTPVYSVSCKSYMAGIWVRDSSAGIGTLTYYDEKGFFGGLGHPVCDTETEELLPLSSGEIVSATISGVTKSRESSAGELKGYFCSGNINGKIMLNCENGVFGFLDNSELPDCPIPIAFCQEIEKGNAKILATIEGKSPEYYSCTIEKINYDNSARAKNMTIRITDPILLEATGGIVQGMSGSPIIQNGRLVGAVTHVFVNNPECGYAVFAEKMYECSKNTENPIKEDAA